ncbi:MAG: 2-oxo acid dehydrogenase subunit E2 [Gammaproteobacteria bacterium]|nr:2-oxo acid dehydrogenase subunit E2 [Gammaproteobacteria bacterium]
MALEIRVPDIGNFKEVEVIDLLVQPGAVIAVEDSLITVESDKATMDIPSPSAGVLLELKVQQGDKVAQGTLIALLDPAVADAAAAKSTPAPAKPTPAAAEKTVAAAEMAPSSPTPQPPPTLPRGSVVAGDSASAKAHASPSVRKFARELGVQLGLVKGTGPKNRIQKSDVTAFVKGIVSGTSVSARGGFALPEIPPIDFSRFGTIESKPLSKVKRLTGQNLHRSWITVPHVTQFNEADFTEAEEFRKSKAAEAERAGIKLTPVSFLLKACVAALRRYPEFNASLAPDGEALIYKKYFHIGVAVDTDQGLVVPVVHDVDQKGLFDIARELRDLAVKARERKLRPADLEGGCFTVSSLGGVGGTQFTPIINVPEVAILGVSRATLRPVYLEGELVPRLILPFSLSYDHRVIDGMLAAEFTEYLRTILSDIRHILL